MLRKVRQNVSLFRVTFSCSKYSTVSTDEQIQQLEQNIKQADEKIKELEYKFKYALAERENFKRDIASQIETTTIITRNNFARSLIDTAEELDKVMHTIQDPESHELLEKNLKQIKAVQTLIQGLMMTNTAFIETFKHSDVSIQEELKQRYSARKAFMFYPIQQKLTLLSSALKTASAKKPVRLAAVLIGLAILSNLYLYL